MTQQQPKAVSDKALNYYASYIVLTSAAEIMLRELEGIMSREHIEYQHNAKRLQTELAKQVARLRYLHDRFTEEIGMNTEKDGVTAFDDILNDANIVAAMTMRCYNATYGKYANTHSILDYIKSLQVREVFTEEEINKLESRI